MEHFAGYKMSALVLARKLDGPAPASKFFGQAARENFSKCPHRHGLAAA